MATRTKAVKPAVEPDLPLVDQKVLAKWIRRFRKVAKNQMLTQRGDITLVFDHEHNHELRDLLVEWCGRPIQDEPALGVWWNDELKVHHRLEIYKMNCALITTYMWQEKKGILSWPFRSSEGRT